MTDDPRLLALPDIHGHAKGEHKPFADERPIPYSARLMFLWFYHAARRGWPRFMMVTDHVNYLTFEDPAAVNLVRRALRLALAGDLYGAAETAGVDIPQATIVSDALRSGMRFTIGAEVDNDPRSRPDAVNVVEAMRPDGIVRSIHFLPKTLFPGKFADEPEDFHWPFDNPEFIDKFAEIGTEETWEAYVELMVEAISTQPTQILGHFYVPGKFGHWPEEKKLEAYEDRILAICKERNIAIELNSRIFYRSSDAALKAKHIEAYTRLIHKAKEHEVGIALGSDAHSPKDQGRAFDLLLPLLDAADINEIVFPIAGQQARVALRVDRARHAAAARAQAARQAAEELANQRRVETEERFSPEEFEDVQDAPILPESNIELAVADQPLAIAKFKTASPNQNSEEALISAEAIPLEAEFPVEPPKKKTKSKKKTPTIENGDLTTPPPEKPTKPKTAKSPSRAKSSSAKAKPVLPTNEEIAANLVNSPAQEFSASDPASPSVADAPASEFAPAPGSLSSVEVGKPFAEIGEVPVPGSEAEEHNLPQNVDAQFVVEHQHESPGTSDDIIPAESKVSPGTSENLADETHNGPPESSQGGSSSSILGAHTDSEQSESGMATEPGSEHLHDDGPERPT